MQDLQSEIAQNSSADGIALSGVALTAVVQISYWKNKKRSKGLRLASAMQSQASGLYSTWDSMPTHSISTSSLTPESYGMNIVNGEQEDRVLQEGSFIKAGSLMYAILDNDLNSEDPTPVLATIANGPLKGSKVLVSFVQNENKIVLKFDRINRPEKAEQDVISVFAVDVNTVNNVEIESHYLLKYGALFRASFLSGLNDVAKNIGTTVSTSTGVNGTSVTVVLVISISLKYLPLD